MINDILNELQAAAIEAGFTSTEQGRINFDSVADTELPKMFITLDGTDILNINLQKLSRSLVYHTDYKFELLCVTAITENPVSSFVELKKRFLTAMSNQPQLKKLFQNGKIKDINTNISNEIDKHRKNNSQEFFINFNLEV